MVRFLRRRLEPDPPPALSIAEISSRLAPFGDDELYRVHKLWVARYVPVWHTVHPEIATAAGWDEAKRAKHRAAIDDYFRRCDIWFSGGTIPKARRNEVESAISAVTHFGSVHLPHAPWLHRAREAVLELRFLLHFVTSRSLAERLQRTATAPYHWAEIDTGWPADTAALLAQVPRDLYRADPVEATVGVYTLVAPRLGLHAEARAVIERVRDIVDHFGTDPGPFPPGLAALAVSDGGAAARAQHAAHYEQFHGRPPPSWLR